MTNPILKFIKETDQTIAILASQIGVSRQALNDIINKRSPKTKVITCLSIKKITGIEPWEYLDGLDKLKSLSSGSSKPTTAAQRAEATQD